MDALTPRSRQLATDDIECWDNDDDLQGIDDLHFRNISTTTVATNASTRGSQHRDFISSRISLKSDLEDEGDWQLLLHNDDELSTKKAIADAKDKGIPLPTNVPTSALLGGTIKRLGGRRIKKAFGDDWNDDFEPSMSNEGGLKLRINDGKEFPDALRQVSATTSQTQSPAKSKMGLSFIERLQSAGQTYANLEKFKDVDKDDDFGDVPTIKVAKNRTPLNLPAFGLPPVKPTKVKETESFEDDFEMPAGGELKLSARKEIPRTPASQASDDFDPDWAAGSQSSLGTSQGGRRTGRSNRSSSISALSPSVFSPSLSSCFTAESEDEGLGGLVLPDGPLKFQEVLQKRLESASPEPYQPPKRTSISSPAKEDFFSGIEIGDGDVFDSRKLTLNRNIKHKPTRLTSPTRRTAMTLTFNKSSNQSNVTTRIPKPAGLDRTRSKLEPVMESGALAPSYRRTQSRLGGHSTQSSVTSIPTPTTISFPPNSGPSTPSHRGLTSRSSREAMRLESTTTNAQLLKAKRSMPVLSTRVPTSPSRAQPSFQRPPSRTERQTRLTTFSRPKTPIDRLGADSCLASSRKPPTPFLPAGNVNTHSHHVGKKSSRTFHRPTSSDSTSNEAPSTRSISRLSNNHHRPNTPPVRRDLAPESLARVAASKRTITKPLRRRAYGDGNELDIFDDLATSATAESKYVKQPVGVSTKASGSLRSKQLYSLQNHSSTSVARTETILRTPLSPQKSDGNVPSWARDTAASRTAREQRIGHNPAQALRHVEHLSSTTNWKPQVNAKAPASSNQAIKRAPKLQRRPHLIKPLNNVAGQEKDDKGMHWNPALCRWEGNEKALVPFDVLPSPKHAGVSPAAKPALIANVGSIKGVQVVGGMVFDPQRMCWLKMAPNSGRGRSESTTVSLTTEEDEDDPFAGLEDLEDETRNKKVDHVAKGMIVSDDEWMVGEEFDVGPDFVRRQKNEEGKWMRRLEGWKRLIGEPDLGLQERWTIRDLVRQ